MCEQIVGVHCTCKCIWFWMFLNYRLVFCLICSWEVSSSPSSHLGLLCLKNVTFHATPCKVVVFLTIEPLVFFGGENMVKGAKGADVKILFQELNMTRVIFVLVYNLIFSISSTPLIFHFRCKYILITIWLYIMYIMHSCLLSHKYEQLLLNAHFQNL
jgi:hypothetical protein